MYMSALGILSKIGAESLTSLYPVFVKNIKLPMATQLWSRFFTYTVISFFFIDKSLVICFTTTTTTTTRTKFLG